MSVQDFIRAMPKMELRVQLEGSFRKDTLLLIAEQNDIPLTTKKFDKWVDLVENPTYAQADDLIENVSSWLRHPDDITRLVYDVGVDLAHQNVRYAEIGLNPSIHMLNDMSFDAFMAAVNDGRDRAERGWGIRIGWLLIITREEPRRADEIMRWASSAVGKKAGVVGLMLIGKEDAQPVGQFERAFANARKKNVPTVASAGSTNGAEGIQQVLSVLEADRVLDATGLLDSPEVLDEVVNKQVPINVCLTRALKKGRVRKIENYPLRRLYDENVKLTISSDLPSINQSNLTDEYIMAVEQGGLSVDELQEIALNAIDCSFLPEEDKAQFRDEFKEQYNNLRIEHLTQEAPES